MKVRTVALVASMAMAAVLPTAEAHALTSATWSVVGEMDSPIASGVVIPLSGARALVTGSDGRDASRVDLYEPSSGIIRVADAPAPLHWHFATKLLDGRVLVGGGGNFFDRSDLTDRTFIYDPATDGWSEAAPLPRPSFYLYGNTVSTLPDGRVLVTGGSTPAEAYFDPVAGFDVYLASRNVFLFEPSGETMGPDGQVLPGSWSEGAPMPVTRVFATHAPAFGTRTGIALGADDTPPRDYAAGRVGHEMVVLPNGHVLVVGGRGYMPGLFYGLSRIDAYDPVSDTWTRLAEMPGVAGDGDGGYGGRGFPGIALLESGDLLIFGGTAERLVERRSSRGVTFDAKGSILPRRSSFLFDPVTRDFQRVGDLNVRRYFPLAGAWADGSGAFAIGGTGIVWERPVPGAEVYDSSAQSWSRLPLEPATDFDISRRKGTLLTDGTVLTWSALPFYDEPGLGGAGGVRTVRRLVPAG